MLTADAFGVLPPVARLTVEQALYYFLSGYTSKVAGTEIGIVDPEAVFSAGFGAPFLPRRPTEYANLLSDCLETHGATAWLVNTGWTGGSFGIGNRIPLESTRAIITAILDGGLESVDWESDPVFGLSIPARCPGVPDALLSPAVNWSDRAAYETVARELAAMFARNFERFAAEVPERVKDAGPQSC